MNTQEAIQEAAQELDRIKPGWADEIDIFDFDIARPCCCVIGQIYPDENYVDKVRELGLNPFPFYADGYDEEPDFEEPSDFEHYNTFHDTETNKLWIKEIKQRQRESKNE